MSMCTCPMCAIHWQHCMQQPTAHLHPYVKKHFQKLQVNVSEATLCAMLHAHGYAACWHTCYRKSETLTRTRAPDSFSHELKPASTLLAAAPMPAISTRAPVCSIVQLQGELGQLHVAACMHATGDIMQALLTQRAFRTRQGHRAGVKAALGGELLLLGSGLSGSSLGRGGRG